MKARRSRQLAALVVVAMGTATAVAAASKPGWEIRRTMSGGPYTAIDTARRCGASEFGTYTIRLTQTFTSGPRAGKTVRVVVTFALRHDHRRHRFHLVSLSGTALEGMSRGRRRALARVVASSFSRYSIQVLRVGKGPRLTTRLWVKGKVASTGALALKRTRCS